MTGTVSALGPLMLDVAGTELTDDDRRRLRHPLTGGVILFSRNYSGPEQLAELTAAIHALRRPPLLIAVDHEGGRIQRFREHFTAIPPMRLFGRIWDEDPARARELAGQAGFVLASELLAHGIDMTFAPVLDLDYGTSRVIGDRAFHARPRAVSELGRALLKGLRQAGMTGVGKHFPGHGHVHGDSHHEAPVDGRPFREIESSDLVPFQRLIEAGLAGIMPAHVVYSAVDRLPAGYSPVWLQRVLRQRLRFTGAVFSDDLSMVAAHVLGDVVQRARAALTAGCDMVLLCNDPAGADELLSGLDFSLPAVSLARLARMHGTAQRRDMAELRRETRYTRAVEALAALGRNEGDLALDA